MLPNEPPGWASLREMARNAKDAKELTAIIDKMNELLSSYEKEAGDGHTPDRPIERSKRTASKTRSK